MHNSFGNFFRITSFGESHGKMVGVVIDGCPPGLHIANEEIQHEVDRRRPGNSELVSDRRESDHIEILSGIENKYSTGAPITIIIKNENFDPIIYEKVKITPRPSHADYPALMRYGKYVDLKGGGRFSGRITASFVAAGAIAKKILTLLGISLAAYIRSIGPWEDNHEYTVAEIRKNGDALRLMNPEFTDRVKTTILKAKSEKDSVGGQVTCIVEGIPSGKGDMVFGSIESRISAAMFAIPSIRGIEFGLGFASTKLNGSQNNDPYMISEGKIQTKTNNAGGILGGLSTGMPIWFTCAIKPTPTIGKPQETVNLRSMKQTNLRFEGSHDPCIVPRIIPVIESLTSVVIVDILMGNGDIPQIFNKK
ncbi:MAG: chorismate synthase [Candidatus Lokiarchaeota archaeon]|nr:chorismate synthase [Candidatus Lokiarchaeota archaeon]